MGSLSIRERTLYQMKQSRGGGCVSEGGGGGGIGGVWGIAKGLPSSEFGGMKTSISVGRGRDYE